MTENQDPFAEDPTAQDPAAQDPSAEESSLESAIDDDPDAPALRAEPGAAGPQGDGIEGADTAFENERAQEDRGTVDDVRGSGGSAVPDDASAADQGNREGDEMAADTPEDRDGTGDDTVAPGL